MSPPNVVVAGQGASPRCPSAARTAGTNATTSIRVRPILDDGATAMDAIFPVAGE
jgi:hypothetical protein